MSRTFEVNRLCDFRDAFERRVLPCERYITSTPLDTPEQGIMEVMEASGWITIGDKDCCYACSYEMESRRVAAQEAQQ